MGNSIVLEFHSQRFSSTGTSGSVDFNFGTWPLELGWNFLQLFYSGTSLWSRYRRGQCSFWPGMTLGWLTTGIYGNQLRIDHILETNVISSHVLLSFEAQGLQSLSDSLEFLVTSIPTCLRTLAKIWSLILFLFEDLNKFSVESNCQESP